MLTRISPIISVREAAAGNEYPPARLTAADLALLWLEMNVSEQCAGGNGGALIPNFADGLPPGFRAHELGFHFTNPDKDILQTAATLLGDNAHRRATLRRDAENLVKKFLAEAAREGKKARAPKIEEPVGCGGCAACVPYTRLRPRRSKSPKTARNFMPARDLAKTARRRRRSEKAAETAARAERRQRSKAARDQMNARRAEQSVVRAAARRGLAQLAPIVTDE